MEKLRITVEGKVFEVTVERADSTDSPASATRPVAAPAAPAPAAAPAPDPAAAPKPASGEGDVLSPLAGVVQSVDATVGATVKAGDTIMTLEAMKMYTPINAESDGTVKAVHVKAGDAVEEGQPLYALS